MTLNILLYSRPKRNINKNYVHEGYVTIIVYSTVSLYAYVPLQDRYVCLYKDYT